MHTHQISAPGFNSFTGTCLLILAAVFFLFPQRASAQRFVDDRLVQTFDVKPGGELYVDTDRGSIEVETARTDEVRVVVERESYGASDADMDQLRFEFDKSGRKVSVIGRQPERMRGRENKFRVRIKIQLPEKFDVDLNTSGGSVSVEDLDGSVTAQTSGGSMSFGRISGPVDARTSGGSITLEESASDAHLRTSGGSISLGRVAGTVDAHTSGGSIKIDEAGADVVARTSGGRISVNEVRGAIDASTSGGSISAYISRQPKADCRLSTGGGSIEVKLDPSVKLSIDARASGGGVRTDLPVSVRGKVERGRLAGELNGGGPMLELETSGGGIRIESIR